MFYRLWVIVCLCVRFSVDSRMSLMLRSWLGFTVVMFPAVMVFMMVLSFEFCLFMVCIFCFDA